MQKSITVFVTSLSLLGLVALWSFGGTLTASATKEQQSEASTRPSFVLTGFSASGIKISAPVSSNITSPDKQISITSLQIGGP